MGLFKDRRDNSVHDLSAGPQTFKGYADYAKSKVGQADMKAQGKGIIQRKIVAPIVGKAADKQNRNRPITVAKKGSTYTANDGSIQSWDSDF